MRKNDEKLKNFPAEKQIDNNKTRSNKKLKIRLKKVPFSILTILKWRVGKRKIHLSFIDFCFHIFFFFV